MIKNKRLSLLVTGFASMMVLAACGGANSDGAAEDVAADETAGGVLNVQVDVEVATMDPQMATDGTSFEVIANTIEGLYTLDESGVAVPSLAEKTDVSEDGLTYTFTLKDATWSNGTPVTADDFVYAWQRLADPDTASEYYYIMGIAGVVNADEISAGEKDPEELGVTAIDEKTLEVKLNHPVPFFESLMAFPSFFPMNQAFFEEAGENYGTSADTLIANGAFEITSYEPAATTIELEKNPDYFDAENVSLDGIKYQVIKDTQQAMLSYQNGDLDVVTLAGEQVDLFKDDPEFQTIQAGYLWYISPNTKVPGLENANLRKALGQAFDKEYIAETVLKDGSNAADYMIPEGLAVDPEGVDFRETTGTYLEFDPAAAQEALELAKEELGKDSFTFTMIIEDTESSINVAQVLKSQIEENLDGVTVEIEQMPKKTRLDRMNVGDYELALTRWGPDYADPMTYADMFLTDSGNNKGFWSNAKYDELVNSSLDGELSLDPEARWTALQEAESIILEDAGILPVYQKGNAVMVKSNVTGVDFHTVGVSRIVKNAVKE
ncbi:oligopeptide transport system substrate-binding protein [Desemzia incerta]|uniref:Oligopeptide transport system substrate-binding protein n=1 Tax=Desemzia incerta TaxID=82801 RepID=A0A1I5UKA7_9LACT|nr:peptide ABC transporter substrate-binding protein [Desemzia incerta]SFP95741.1 oligopeptide transport system substrate-binding protein [Desemzia incerta]